MRLGKGREDYAPTAMVVNECFCLCEEKGAFGKWSVPIHPESAGRRPRSNQPHENPRRAWKVPLPSLSQIRKGREMRFLLLFLSLLAPLLSAEPLRVGMDMSYPPFEMRDEQGQPAGVSVDLARMLGEKLGRPVEFQNMPFDGLIPSLKTGRVDILLSSMTATEERAVNVDFSEPYLKTGLCLLVGVNSGITSFADLDAPSRKVAVVKSTTGHLWAMKNLKQAKLLALAKETACAMEVSQGKADAFIYDQMSTLRNWQKSPDTTKALLKPFKEEQWAVALKKGNEPLRIQINAALAALRKEGAFDRLSEKWLKEQKAAFEKLGVPFVF